MVFEMTMVIFLFGVLITGVVALGIHQERINARKEKMRRNVSSGEPNAEIARMERNRRVA